MNILVLTSVYPSEDDKNQDATKVVRYFVQEWSKDGHRIIVIHNIHRYPSIIHKLPNSIKQKMASKINFYIPDWKTVKEDKNFLDNNVEIWRLPILKLMPHKGHSKRIIKKQSNKIKAILEARHFSPEIIMGHWMSPQLQIISELRKIYLCKTSLVIHGREYYIRDKKFNCIKYLTSIDALGCRNNGDSEYVKRVLGLRKSPFICYSGIPDAFITNCIFDKGKFQELPKQWRIIYVGRLVAYKHVETTIRALAQLDDYNFIFDIIGIGPEEKALKLLANKLGIGHKVIFHGKMSREQVFEYMHKAHCFVMLSKGEAFGLVYLEAMASSCIVIASKGEGIDGIIKDKENCFLIPVGDKQGLIICLEKLFNSQPQELQYYSHNAFITASQFTDSNVAKRYLQDAMTFMEYI
ncbi:MAG: glycosyltransferase [Rectinema sp.]